MREYIIRRALQSVPILIAISIFCFVVIQLPPGDFLTTYVANLSASGQIVDQAEVEALRDRYGLDQPMYVQYLKWITNFIQGDMGQSFYWNRPVNTLLSERMATTILISVLTLILTYGLAIPMGIISATRQYSWIDHILTVFGFLGLATPNFLLALILLWIGIQHLGMGGGGLFSPEFIDAPWSLARFWDFLKHVWLPVVIIGTSGIAEIMRIMRATTLDELGRPYVEAARAKGLKEGSLVRKYPVRVALNPILSTIGWQLPVVVSGSVIVASVLGLPTVGPLLWQSLTTQDMFLAASILMLLSFLTVVGTLLSDILLAWIDPRIRYGSQEI
jgi:peptide/nickel transport system permease protein